MINICLIQTSLAKLSSLTVILEAMFTSCVTPVQLNNIHNVDIKGYNIIIAPTELRDLFETTDTQDCVFYDSRSLNLISILNNVFNTPTVIGKDVDYKSVDPSKFRYAKASIYVRINSSKYVKIYDGSSNVFKHCMQKLISRGINKVYLTKDDYSDYVNSVLVSLYNKVELDTIESTVSDLNVVVTNLGVTPEVRQTTEHIIQTVIVQLKSVGKIPNIDHLVKEIVKGDSPLRASYILATYLCIKQGWTSPSTLKKIVSAMVLQDLGLDPELTKYESLDSALSDPNITTQQIKEIKEHPYKAARLADRIGGIVKGASLIIEQHHERPDGSGFPKGLQANKITPISALCIIAHDIGNALYSSQFSNLNELLAHHRSLYIKAPFRGLFSILEESY